VEWLTVAFVVICALWMVVMLFMYEWRSIHTHSK
jgi:hypothetical protein